MAQGIADWLDKDLTDLITKDDINQALVASNYEIDLASRQISSLAGFEIFNGTDLKELQIRDNQITSLDARGLTKLELLSASDNQLTNVQVSGLTNLNTLGLRGNPLTSGVNVSGLFNLQYLNVSESQLASLNVSGLTNLTNLSAWESQITSLNLTGLTNLRSLDATDSQLTGLNVTGLTNLVYLYVSPLTASEIIGLDDLNLVDSDLD